MLKHETKTIGGNTYEVSQLPYSIGHKVLLRLMKAVGPSLSQLFANAPELKGKKVSELDLKELAPSAAAVSQRLAEDLNEEDFQYVTDTLAEYSWLVRDGKKLPLLQEREFLFAGNYLEMFKWLAFALRVNFLGFTNGRDVLTDLALQQKAEDQ